MGLLVKADRRWWNDARLEREKAAACPEPPRMVFVGKPFSFLFDSIEEPRRYDEPRRSLALAWARDVGDAGGVGRAR